MVKVLGLSHLVFTVEHIPTRHHISPFLDFFYGSGGKFQFDHSSERNSMLRAAHNSISRLTLFGAKGGDMPAIELLDVQSASKRNPRSYGLIINGEWLNNLSEDHIDVGISNYSMSGHFDELLQTHICTRTDLPMTANLGCWIRVRDFIQQRNFLASIASAKVFIDNDGIFAVNVKVVNRKFSDFNIFLIKDEMTDHFVFNDDLGLSTLGWIVKDLDEHECATGFDNESALLQIKVNNNSFDAKFLYNNKSVSHELLQKK